MNPEHWLAAARTGGLPVPNLPRWQPLRVGVANLWEYDDAEFWYADGRLVLRGGNGAGKTKLLELTTLLLLRGEINPTVLDPFGSQHRTMRFNLLPTGEDDDPRPMSDSGMGYAWAEYGRLDEDGEPAYLVCGMGASARRGSGTEPVKRWMFLTSRRPGADLVLAPASGPRDEKELRKEPGVSVYDNSGLYRTDLAAGLFGLDPVGFDNLTDLLKQLRRPKLGERLNPKELERTLTDALPQLDAGEVTQLVQGWDRLAELRTSVEQLERAATKVSQFTRRAWLPWVRIVARRRSDDVIAANSQFDRTTRERRHAETQLSSVRKKVGATGAAVKKVRIDLGDRRTELTALVDSSAYQDAVVATQRADSLAREAKREAELAEEARGRAEHAQQVLSEALDALEVADDEFEAAELEVAERAEGVRDLAGPSGLTADTLIDSRDLLGLRSLYTTQVERLAHVTGLHQKWEAAQDRLKGVADLLEDRQERERRLRDEARLADETVSARAEDLGGELTRWAAGLTVASCDQVRLGAWHALVPTIAERGELLLTKAIGVHIGEEESRLRGRLATLTSARVDLDRRRVSLEAELAKAHEVREEPPPAPVLWKRRDRSVEDGAPFWACVQPRTDDAGELARLEATLAAAGLLDAWLTPDGALVTGPETVLTPAEPAAANLLDVLEPLAVGAVESSTVTALLRGIGWFPRTPDEAGGLWLAADGTWRVGALTGRAEPVQPASYLGATAREQARQRLVLRLEQELAELGTELAANLEKNKTVSDLMSRLAEESAGAPDIQERALVKAATEAEVAWNQHERAASELTGAQRDYDQAEAARNAARAEAARYAAEHGFVLDALDETRQALSDLRTELDRLKNALDLLTMVRRHHAKAVKTHARAESEEAAAEQQASRAQEAARRKRIEAETAQNALRTDHREQLSLRTTLDALVGSLEKESMRLSDELVELRAQEQNAANVLDEHQQRRTEAEERRDAAVTAWWHAADCGFVAPLGVVLPAGRAVTATLEAAQAVRREIAPAQADAVAQERAWRRCFEELQELRQVLLPNRDGKVREDEDGDLPRVVIVVDAASGHLPPDQADAALTAHAQAQQERFKSEQQEVLTKLLGSAFIEHLKDRLDYTESVFARINTCLAAHPTRQGHTLQLQWRATPDEADAGQVVEALRQGYEHLAPARQDMVRDFLRRRIEDAREEAEGKGLADWRQELTTALDYRQWLRIELQFRPGRTGRWRPFDAARHGSKSGGEKVVLLSQPLFAAAVVAYDAAGPAAPRQVWLDEAMTGVDNEVKAGFMALTVELDLDLMITAHDEWCRYATVPAAAVYDLARQKHLPGVDALPHLWCGGDWTVLDSTSVARPAPAVPPDEEGTLFDG